MKHSFINIVHYVKFISRVYKNVKNVMNAYIIKLQISSMFYSVCSSTYTFIQELNSIVWQLKTKILHDLLFSHASANTLGLISE